MVLRSNYSERATTEYHQRHPAGQRHESAFPRGEKARSSDQYTSRRGARKHPSRKQGPWKHSHCQISIKGNTLEVPAIEEELNAKSSKLKWDRLDPVCVIYAGGTVGMVQQRASDELHADFEMATGAETIVRHLRPKIARLLFNMHFFSLENTIDSSSVTAANWVDLANLIKEQMLNYQGFVILHGTNTLAYTASALSFLLNDIITRPVVLTGAEVPLSVSNTDAVHNVEHATRAAAYQAYDGPTCIPEVCVYWNNHLYRGNRVTKRNASDRASSFHTPNMAVPLGTLANDRLDIDHEHIRRMSPDAIEDRPQQTIHDVAKPHVDVMFIHPDMDFSDLPQALPAWEARWSHLALLWPRKCPRGPKLP